MAMLRMIQELSGGKTREELRRYFHLEERVARVATLARIGQFEEADALAANWPEPPPARLLDLRARIAAQQGKWVAARQFWEEARKADPGNATYEAGLGRIETASRRQGMRGYYWLMSLALATAALATALLVNRCSVDPPPHQNAKIKVRQTPTPAEKAAASVPPVGSPPRETPTPAATATESPKPEVSPSMTPTPAPEPTPEKPTPAPEKLTPAVSASPEVSPPSETGPAPSP